MGAQKLTLEVFCPNFSFIIIDTIQEGRHTTVVGIEPDEAEKCVASVGFFEYLFVVLEIPAGKRAKIRGSEKIFRPRSAGDLQNNTSCIKPNGAVNQQAATNSQPGNRLSTDILLHRRDI